MCDLGAALVHTVVFTILCAGVVRNGVFLFFFFSGLVNTSGVLYRHFSAHLNKY